MIFYFVNVQDEQLLLREIDIILIIDKEKKVLNCW